MSKKSLEPLLTLDENTLPPSWRMASIPELIGEDGVFVDGDWVESKDQDPDGDVRLIQLADVGDGGYRNKSARFLTSKKAKELRCSFLEAGDVLIARMPDPLGRACIFPGDKKHSVTVVDVAFARSGNGEFNHKWLMHFVNAPAFRAAVASLQSGTTRKRISRKNLSRILLPVPPRDQQDSIVAEIEKQFSRLDEAVASLKRVKANLKRYKAAVLKAAVEGKLTEDLPSRQAGWRDSSFRNISGKLVPEETAISQKDRKKYFAYVLECEDGSLYKGFCKNLFARIDQYLAGQGAKWTKDHKPVSIIHFEEFETEEEAVEREKYFKSGSGREWLNEVRERQNKKYEPASKFLERILAERRARWEVAELAKMKAKGKVPKNDKWKEKLKDPVFDSDDFPFDLPEGWVWTTVDALLYAVEAGKSFKCEERPPAAGEVGVVKVSAVSWGTYQEGESKTCHNPERINKELFIRRGDFLFSRANTIELVGACVVVDSVDLDVMLSDKILRLRVVSQVRDWLLMFLRSTYGRFEIERLATGNQQSMRNIGQSRLRSIRVPLPPAKEMAIILAIVAAKLSSIEKIYVELKQNESRSASLRSSILSGTFLGR